MNPSSRSNDRSVTLLVAGAAGALGRCVVREAVKRGYAVRALLNRSGLADPPPAVAVCRADARDPSQLEHACAGVDIVFSALGASVQPDIRRGRQSYYAVDTRANRNLIAAACDAGIRKFVYVSVACHEALRALAYVRAHEEVVETLSLSGIPHLVIRPTGFYAAFSTLLPMAVRGRLPIIGDGSAKTNPIDETDVAREALDALGRGDGEIELGGPGVLTRREIVEEAFRAVRVPTRVTPIPEGVARLMGWAMWPINPRMAQLSQFVASVSTQDVVAPKRGRVRLADYFANAAAAMQAT